MELGWGTWRQEKRVQRVHRGLVQSGIPPEHTGYVMCVTARYLGFKLYRITQLAVFEAEA